MVIPAVAAKLVGGGVVAASSVAAASSEWGSPTGVAAIGTLVIATGTLAWSIYSGMRKNKQIDLEAAVELIELMEKHHREEHREDPGDDHEA